MLRHSPLFQFRHGDHICVFYRSENALMEFLAPYIAEGLRKDERCFCVQKPHTLRRLIYDLRFIGIDTDREVERGALDLHVEDEVYLPNGRFEPEKLMDMLLKSIETAVKNGFSGLRTAGELSWSVRGRNECDRLVGYEKLVDKYFPGKQVIGVCQYAIDEFSPEVLDLILDAHRLHLADQGPAAIYSSINIGYGHCNAEFVADKFVVDPRYYYVVQQKRQKEVLGWGSAPDINSATIQAEKIVKSAAAGM